jgi:hypothetical protein
MERVKWLSLVIAGLYVLFLGVECAFGPAGEDSSLRGLLEGIAGVVFWLGLPLGCIWYSDELGEGLLGARFGLVSSPSPGWAVQLMGWILLLLPGMYVLFRGCRSLPSD